MPTDLTTEANAVLTYLASMPMGVTTCTAAVARKVLLDTSGRVLAHGRMYRIKATSLGAGVYEMTLEDPSR